MIRCIWGGYCWGGLKISLIFSCSVSDSGGRSVSSDLLGMGLGGGGGSGSELGCGCESGCGWTGVWLFGIGPGWPWVCPCCWFGLLKLLGFMNALRAWLYKFVGWNATNGLNCCWSDGAFNVPGCWGNAPNCGNPPPKFGNPCCGTPTWRLTILADA